MKTFTQFIAEAKMVMDKMSEKFKKISEKSKEDMCEEVVEIDELDISTMNSYVSKAHKSAKPRAAGIKKAQDSLSNKFSDATKKAKQTGLGYKSVTGSKND